MQGKGLEPKATTFTALISAHCKSDNLQAALEVDQFALNAYAAADECSYSDQCTAWLPKMLVSLL